ncbi:KamA family radical SAM protein [bacterium]|nr:MAG: KamA family radical SAM protein [bacterium]
MESRWQKCWDAAYEIYILLKESETLESAREKLIKYLEALDWSYRRDFGDIDSWEYILLKEAVRCLKNVISPRNERLAKNIPLKYLWTAARNGDADVSDHFIAEFEHLFKAVKGKSGVYPSRFTEKIDLPDFYKYKGRTAAVKRSDFLDKMGAHMNKFIKKYRTGLERNTIKKRKENKKRILKTLGASEKDWNDWKWQFRNVFKDKADLKIIKKIIRLTPGEEYAIKLAVEHGVPFGITPYYLHLMDPEPTEYDFAVRRQVIPPASYVENMIKHKRSKKIAFDFMREHDTSPLDLITRRYPTVAIIKPYNSCPQICVYCQRNWEITSPFMKGAQATRKKIDEALDWYAKHDQIMDVLITGGDPLVLSDDKIDYILGRFSEMKHIRNLRIATRIPITVPQRITNELCDIFAKYYETGKQTLCMVTHFAHPYEVTLETAEAIKKVKMHGLHVYNQEVFNFANSRKFETVALRIAIKQIGVDPYYNFNMKGKSEIESYAVPVARILQERKEEARLLPGIFRTDEPVFNVPFLGKNHLRSWQDHELISIMPDGRRVYSFHPWEKNITKVKPYLYKDVPIGEYLERLEDRGENIEDYRDIWYYY